MKLNVVSWSAPDLQRTAVLVHGIAGAGSNWRRVARALVQRGYHCQAPDVRGHGASRAPDDEYAIEQLVRDLGESVENAPELLVGFSLGGALVAFATLAGVLCPRRLVLVDPALHALEPVDAETLLRSAETSPADVEGVMAVNPRWHRIDAEERVRTFSTTDWSTMRRILLHDARWDLRPRLRELAACVPTLLILADPSHLVPPPDAAAAARQLGGDAVVSLPNTSHSVHRDDFEGFLRTIDGWLNSGRPPN